MSGNPLYFLDPIANPLVCPSEHLTPSFNLVHCLLHPTKPHGLLGYAEVIETIAWGLEALGHEVRRSVNVPLPDCINIVFGAQALSLAALEALPPHSIVYNFEQTRNVPLDQIRPEVRFVATRFRIWDYTPGNLEAWSRMGAGDRVSIVPIGYAPTLTRIPKAEVQDIDVLIYGKSDERRLQAFHVLAEAGLSAVFLAGFYGSSRDSFIARSKVILNVNFYTQSRLFEIVRVSYLLANRKAVLSLADEDTIIDDDIKACVRFTNFDKLAANCRVFAETAEARAVLENHGFSVFSARDIRAILTKALAAVHV